MSTSPCARREEFHSEIVEGVEALNERMNALYKEGWDVEWPDRVDENEHDAAIPGQEKPQLRFLIMATRYVCACKRKRR
jgi:hypothetical protein